MDLGAQPMMLLLLLQGTSTNHHNLIQQNSLVSVSTNKLLKTLSKHCFRERKVHQ